MGEVLRVPILRRLWYAQLVSTFGDFLALFAVINFLTFHLDATARDVAGLQIAYLLRIAMLVVLAGVFVARRRDTDRLHEVGKTITLGVTLACGSCPAGALRSW
jgi:predicted transporter